MNFTEAMIFEHSLKCVKERVEYLSHKDLPEIKIIWKTTDDIFSGSLLNLKKGQPISYSLSCDIDDEPLKFNDATDFTTYVRHEVFEKFINNNVDLLGLYRHKDLLLNELSKLTTSISSFKHCNGHEIYNFKSLKTNLSFPFVSLDPHTDLMPITLIEHSEN